MKILWLFEPEFYEGAPAHPPAQELLDIPLFTFLSRYPFIAGKLSQE